MADLALRPLSMGELLDRAFTIFRQRFGAIILSLIVALAFPILLLTNNLRSLMELMQQGVMSGSPQAMSQVMFTLAGKVFLIVGVFVVAMVIGKAAVLWITHKALLGEPEDVWTALGHGFKMFFPLLGLAIVEMGIYFATEIVLYIPAIILGVGSVAASGGRPGAAFGFGIFAWVIVVVVVMLYLTAALFVTTAVLMAEVDGGVFKAVARSWELTKGRRGSILGMVLLVSILLWIVMFGVSFALSLLLPMAGRGAGPEAAGGALVIVFGLQALFGVLVAGFFNVLQMTTYYDLRVRKEGLDLELASAAMPAT